MTQPEMILRDAADYIAEHGWTVGIYENDDGQVCMFGAMQKVSRHADVAARVLAAHLYLIMQERNVRPGVRYYPYDTNTSTSLIMYFNDFVAYSDADVVSLMRAATDPEDLRSSTYRRVPEGGNVNGRRY